MSVENSCTICLCKPSVIHMHHTIPRSRGGENSLQIPLCGSCHNILHANALYVVSRLKNPKRAAETFWNSEALRERADRWLKILVEALVTPNEERASITEHLIGTKLSAEDFRLFKILARDLGCSQENAVAYCVKYVLQKRGFKNEKTKPELWFLPVPKS
jgi:hypothetical protein